MGITEKYCENTYIAKKVGSLLRRVFNNQIKAYNRIGFADWKSLYQTASDCKSAATEGTSVATGGTSAATGNGGNIRRYGLSS